MKEFVKKHVILSYLLLTFITSWAIYISYIIVSGKDVKIQSPSTILISLLIGVFPSLSALIITYIKEGKIKNSTLLSRLKKKSSLKFYLLVLLIMPVYTLVQAFFANMLVSPYHLHITWALVVLGFTWGIFSAFGEEFGWRGLVLPRFLQKYGLLGSGLLLGVIWGVWHLPMNYLSALSSGDDISSFLLIGTVHLVLDSVIMAGIFVKAKGNLKMTLLYHYTLTGMTIMKDAIWEVECFSHTNEVYINVIGFAIKILIAVLVYCSVRKQEVIAC